MSFKIFINKEVIATAPDERGAYNVARRIENGEDYFKLGRNDVVSFGESEDSRCTVEEYRILHEEEMFKDVEYD